MHRKVVALVAAVVGFAACGPAWAGWPDDKPIEVVIGFAPGGGTDVMARKLLPFVEQRLGGKAKFVVLNKPGAGGEIACGERFAWDGGSPRRARLSSPPAAIIAPGELDSRTSC